MKWVSKGTGNYSRILREFILWGLRFIVDLYQVETNGLKMKNSDNDQSALSSTRSL